MVVTQHSRDIALLRGHSVVGDAEPFRGRLLQALILGSTPSLLEVGLESGWQLAGYVALAALVGVLGAVGPARSAAPVDALRAVVTD
jgi:hypothetical protein